VVIRLTGSTSLAPFVAKAATYVSTAAQYAALSHEFSSLCLFLFSNRLMYNVHIVFHFLSVLCCSCSVCLLAVFLFIPSSTFVFFFHFVSARPILAFVTVFFLHFASSGSMCRFAR